MEKTTQRGALGSVVLTSIIRAIKKNEKGGACSTYGRQERYIQGFGGETLEKEPLGRPRCRWENDVEMDMQEVGWGGRTGLIWRRIGTGGELLLMW